MEQIIFTMFFTVLINTCIHTAFQHTSNTYSWRKDLFSSCQEEDMYKYTESADKCVKGDLSYKAWMIIAAGAGGLIILILLFAIVIQCARRKRKSSNPEKYVYDAGWVTSLRKERNSAFYPTNCLIWNEEIYFENVFVEFDNQF